MIDRWQRLGNEALAISSITEAELLFGLEKRGSQRLWLEYRHYLENSLVILPVNKGVAAHFARLKAIMEQSGTRRADFDLLIAARAIQHGLTVATLDLRHFTNIPGLQIEDWSLLPPSANGF